MAAFLFTLRTFFYSTSLFLPSTDISSYYTTQYAPSGVSSLCFACAFRNPPTAVSKQPLISSLPQSSPVILREEGHKQAPFLHVSAGVKTIGNLLNISTSPPCRNLHKTAEQAKEKRLRIAKIGEVYTTISSKWCMVISSSLPTWFRLHTAQSIKPGAICWSVSVCFISSCLLAS